MGEKLIYAIELQDGVHEGLVRMYDRYIEISLAAPSKHLQPLMNYPDFANQVIVRGMTAYAAMLATIEKELG